MKKIYISVMVLLLVAAFGCNKKAVDAGALENTDALDEEKLAALIDEAFADFERRGLTMRYTLDVDQYKTDYGLIYHDDGRIVYPPWDIYRRSDIEYEMISTEDYGEGILEIIITFETGEKYIIKESEIRELWIERK